MLLKTFKKIRRIILHLKTWVKTICGVSLHHTAKKVFH